MNDNDCKTCWAVVTNSAVTGTASYAVYLSKTKADAYASHLNEVYKEAYGHAGPYFVEECDFDGDLGEDGK